MAERDDDESDPLCGTTLGDFLLVERLDEGGMGIVYRAEQRLLGRDVALKVLQPARRGDGDSARRFLREAQLASRLDHDYATRVIAFGAKEGEPMWIAMELVKGASLDTWLREPMSLEQFAPFFECVADVVQAAHDRAIVHRDLKPGNIMVLERPGVLLPKLLDFGIAKVLGGVDGAAIAVVDDDEPRPEIALAGDGAETQDAGRTPRQAPSIRPKRRVTRTTWGSPPYMGPECWSRPADIGPASDLYALGVIIYEALTGQRPFFAPTLTEWSVVHCRQPVPPVGDGLPAALDAFFARALAKRPADRFASATEMAATLTAIAAGQPEARVRAAAIQWDRAKRRPELLWRGTELAELESWLAGPGLALERVGYAFVEASRADARAMAEARQREELAIAEAKRREELAAIEVRQREERAAADVRDREVRRRSRFRRWIAAVTAAAGLAAIQYRGYVKSEAAGQLAVESITVTEREQGRQAVLHGELAEARLHLGAAYERGDHSPEIEFMLARSLQPRLAELGRLSASSGRMWSSRFSPDGTRIVTTDDRAAQVWDAQTHRLLLTLRHGGIVYDAVWSGATLITACADGAIRIWDATSGTLVHELRHGAKPLRQYIVAAAPDGRHVAAIDAMGDVAQIWEAQSGAWVADLPNDGSEFPSVAFSADGRWLATGGGDDVRLFETSSWTRVSTLGSRVHAIAFDPTGPSLLTGAATGDASIWDATSGARLRHLREVGDPIEAVAYAPNGRLVATGGRNGGEQVWSTDSGALVSQGSMPDKIFSVEFDGDSRRMVAASASGTVAVIDVELGMPLAMLDGPTALVRGAHFDRSYQRVVGASHDGTARIWDAAPQYRRWSSPIADDRCMEPASTEPDRRFVAIACNGTQIWDTARDQLLARLPAASPGRGDFASAMPAVSPRGDRAAIARGSSVEIYSVPASDLVQTIAHADTVTAVAFAPNGDLVSGAADGTLLVAREGRDLIVLPAARGGVDAVALLADGRVVSADAQRHLRIYDPDRDRVLADLETPARTRMLRSSPDARSMVVLARLTSTAPVPATLWDLEHYSRIAELDHHGLVYSSRFVAGGILTAGGDGAVRLWDTATGRQRQIYRAKSRFLVDATLSPDGTIVAAGGVDGMLRLWDAQSGRPLWVAPAHRAALIGIHFEGTDIVTRGQWGDLVRWVLPPADQVIARCRDCGIVTP